MRTTRRKSGFRMFFVSFLALVMMVSTSLTAFAAGTKPEVKLNGDNTITFSNLDNLAQHESMEFDVIDSKGNPAKIAIQRMSSTNATSRMLTASNTDWKVSFTGGTINAHFYMTVSNNKVTDVYDEWIGTIGGTFSDDTLDYTSKYGKLKFTVDAYAGIASFKCWLKGTVTGKDNDIKVTWQM